MFIRSESLFLRPYWPEDRAELLALANQAQALGAGPAGWPETLESVLSAPDGDRRCPRFLITRPDGPDAQIIGFVGLRRGEQDIEAGLWIAPTDRGKGYAVEAGEALLAIARSLGLPRVIACVGDPDEGARRLLARLRFTRRGEVLEHVFASPCDDDGSPLERLAA